MCKAGSVVFTLLAQNLNAAISMIVARYAAMTPSPFPLGEHWQHCGVGGDSGRWNGEVVVVVRFEEDTATGSETSHINTNRWTNFNQSFVRLCFSISKQILVSRRGKQHLADANRGREHLNSHTARYIAQGHQTRITPSHASLCLIPKRCFWLLLSCKTYKVIFRRSVISEKLTNRSLCQLHKSFIWIPNGYCNQSVWFNICVQHAEECSKSANKIVEPFIYKILPKSIY